MYSEDGALTYTLKVRKARYRGPLSFNTRSYSTNGFPGPTLRVKPGDRIDLTLENDLEYPTQADITWTGYEYDLATAFGACEPYNSPNMTSLHFHGLLISINKKGDSPMRICGPGESINYQFTIPESHPSGTYFYHPHGDGSHSLQAAGLMAGVIIVEDENDGGNEGEDDTYHEVDDDNIDDFYAKDDDTDDGGGMPSVSAGPSPRAIRPHSPHTTTPCRAAPRHATPRHATPHPFTPSPHSRLTGEEDGDHAHG